MAGRLLPSIFAEIPSAKRRIERRYTKEAAMEIIALTIVLLVVIHRMTR